MISIVSPRILHADQLAEQRVPLGGVADLQREHPVHVLLRRAEAVDARHRRDDDRVPPGKQGVGGRVPQALHLLVERGVLLDVGVGLRDVRFGLVVVVVGDEVLDRIARQHLAQFVGELRGQRLVRQQDQHRPLQPLRDPGHRGGLAGPGRAEQDGVLIPGPDAPFDVGDRRRLVARGDHVADDMNRRDASLQIGNRAHGTDLLTFRGFNSRPGV
jgi:hypothetical protein